MSRRDFPALTGLRFFLALWVVLHHLTGPGQKLEATALLLPHGLFTLIRGGYQAVTTFFVLSGFVLTRSYAATVWNQRNTLRYAGGWRVCIPSICSASWWWRRLSGRTRLRVRQGMWRRIFSWCRRGWAQFR